MALFVFLALSVPGATFCYAAIGYEIRKKIAETVARTTQF